MKRFISDTSTPVARINVVPIIDVALVLVIILMVTAPMIAVSNLDIQVPVATTRTMEGVDRVNVTLGPSGELAVDDAEVTPNGFGPALTASLAAHDEDILVVVRADARISYEKVAALAKEIRALGATRIALGTTQRGGETANE
jgi:biopolymer transport protein ExbD